MKAAILLNHGISTVGHTASYYLSIDGRLNSLFETNTSISLLPDGTKVILNALYANQIDPSR